MTCVGIFCASKDKDKDSLHNHGSTQPTSKDRLQSVQCRRTSQKWVLKSCSSCSRISHHRSDSVPRSRARPEGMCAACRHPLVIKGQPLLTDGAEVCGQISLILRSKYTRKYIHQRLSASNEHRSPGLAFDICWIRKLFGEKTVAG